VRNDKLVAACYIAVAMACTVGPYLTLQIIDGAYTYRSDPNSTNNRFSAIFSAI
jgi:hypothetical protein